MNPKMFQNNQGTWNVVDADGKYYGSFRDMESAKACLKICMNAYNSMKNPSRKPDQTKTVYVIEFAEEGRKTAYYSSEGWWYDIARAQHHDSQTLAESCAFRITTEQPYYAARLSIKEHVVEL